MNNMREMLNKLNESLAEDPKQQMAELAYQLSQVVGAMWKLYDEHAELNTIQPANTQNVFPSSLDEWWHEIQSYTKEWEKIASGAYDIYVSVTEEGGTPFTMKLTDFFKDNADGIDSSEQNEILTALNNSGVYHGGGGAAGAWSITKIS